MVQERVDGPQADGLAVVRVSVTYALPDARAIVMMGLARRAVVVYLAAVAVCLAVLVAELSLGRPMPWSLVSVGVGLAALVILLFVVSPRKMVRTSPTRQSWEVSSQGAHITLPGTDLRHEWARFDEVVVRPSLVQFRIGKVSLALPRRCLSVADLATLQGLASAAGVPVREGGRLR